MAWRRSATLNSDGRFRCHCAGSSTASALTWIVGPSQDKAGELRTRTAGISRVAYVGDTADDISYACRAGALAVAFTGGYHDADQLREAGPDLVINDLSQLIPLLRAPRD
jgi:phosphoglycolate phosphatase-like HAD superfamily hydrolase